MKAFDFLKEFKEKPKVTPGVEDVYNAYLRLFRDEYVEDAAKLEEAIGLSVPETILEMAASNYL